MDTELLCKLFNNMDVTRKVVDFCEGFEEYQQAKADARVWYEKVGKLMEKHDFFQFEAAVSRYYSIEAQAYYVFGLHLREELKRAMMEGCA